MTRARWTHLGLFASLLLGLVGSACIEGNHRATSSPSRRLDSTPQVGTPGQSQPGTSATPQLPRPLDGRRFAALDGLTTDPSSANGVAFGIIVEPPDDEEPVDHCPDDDDKLEPGICGCGVPDIDRDHDGTADCHDGCPRDPAKLSPGACGCGAAEMPVMDYEVDSQGQPIRAGQRVETAYAEMGVTLTVFRPDDSVGWVIAFDSSAPTGGDLDLGTPGEAAGGPGRGAGGATNTEALGNLLISAERFVDANQDELEDNPDDEACGATFVFSFDHGICVREAVVVDVEQAEFPAEFFLYNGSDQLIATIEGGGLGNNSVERVTMDVCEVHTLEVHLVGTGALDELQICPAQDPDRK